MLTLSSCPTDGRLKLLLDGQLAEGEQSDMQRHIDECESCQRTLEGLVAGQESWDGVARQLANGDVPVTPALADVIQGAKEIPAQAATLAWPTSFLKPSDQPDSLGRIEHYEVLQKVGSGGMGFVYKAFDTSLRRVVAIKVMAPHLATNSAARRRFVREAQAAAAVAHEHVVAIHAVADQHEPPYLAMQFIEGKTLQERIDMAGPLSVREVLRIGMQTAAGLAAAHAQGLVHRDIKPANILLENGVERVKLTDFGLARAVDDASMTQSGVIAGTPLFMSPEQARGDSIDHRSDLFSLGSVLYAMCVGHAPFRASTTMGVIKRVCDESPRPIREVNPEVPDWLVKLIDKLLSKRREDRFQSAQEVASLLGQCLAHWQQPQTSSLPRELAGAPSQSSAVPTASETRRPLKLLTLSVLGLWVVLMILRGLRLMTWQNVLFASYLLGPSLLVTVVVDWFIALRRRKHSASGAESSSPVSGARTDGWRLRCLTCGKTGALASVDGVRIGAASAVHRTLARCTHCGRFRWAAIEWGELPPTDPANPQQAPIVRRTRIGFAIGMLGGLLTVFWMAQRASHLIPGVVGLWIEHLCEAALFLLAMFLLLAGVFAGCHHGLRSQSQRKSLMIPWLGFAAVCFVLFLFLADNLAGRWKGWLMECSITFLSVRPEDRDLSLRVHAVRPEAEFVSGGPVGGTTSRLSPGDVHLLVKRAQRVVHSELLTLYPGQHLGYQAFPGLLDFEKLQGRWRIVERKGNIVLPADAETDDGPWIEFDEERFRVGGTARSMVLFRNELKFAISPTSPLRNFDLLGYAKGVYKLDGDRLTIWLAEPGQPRPRTNPADGVTTIVCQRMANVAHRNGMINIWRLNP